MLFSSFIADCYYPFTVVQPAGEPVANTIGLAGLNNSTFPVRHVIKLTSTSQGKPAAIRMHITTLQIFDCGNELPLSLNKGGIIDNLNLLILFCLQVITVDICTGMIYYLLSVRFGIPGIILFLFRMFPDIVSVRIDRVDIAHTFVVRDKIYPLTNPHGRSEITL